MGGLRQAGMGGTLGGMVITALGFIPGLDILKVIGTVMMLSGSVAVALDPPKPPDPKDYGTHFAFSQYRNEILGDTPIPVPYGKIMVAPVIAQAYLTPVDDKGAWESGAAMGAEDQAITMMCILGEGPIPEDAIEQIYINDEELWEIVDEDLCGTGDGTETKFRLTKQYPRMETIKIYIGGAQKSRVSTGSRTYHRVGTGHTVKGSTLASTFEAKEGDRSIIDVDSVEVFLNYNRAPGVAQIGLTYRVEGVNERTFKIVFSSGIPEGYTVNASYTYWYADREVKKLVNVDGWVSVTLATPPTAGQAVAWSGEAQNFPSVELDFRRGEINQAPVLSANEVKNTYSVAKYMDEDTAVTHTTDVPVDDVVVTVACLNGLIHFHGRSEALNRLEVQYTIDYRQYGDTAWINLPLPAEDGYEFELKGKTINPIHMEVSLKRVLKAGWKSGIVSKAKLEAFDRSRYEVQLTRKNKVRADVNDRNRDKAWFQSVTEVQEEVLSYPGTAYIILHAVASERVQGSLPNIKVRMKGREVKNLDTGVTEWTQNPAWCLADLITHTRYGAGEAEARLITADWITWADWCDEMITAEDGESIVRCQLDVVLDRARAPLQQIKDLAFPHWGVPVLQGRRWGVFIDMAADSVKTMYFSGSSANELHDTLTATLESRAKAPTEIEALFNDADRDYERRALLVVPTSRADDRRTASINLYGVTRRRQAVLRAHDVLKASETEQYVVEFDATPDALLLEAGDVVTVRAEILDEETPGKDFRVIRVGVDFDLNVKLLVREYAASRYSRHWQSVPAAYSPPSGVNTPAASTTVAASATTMRTSLTGWKNIGLTMTARSGMVPS